MYHGCLQFLNKEITDASIEGLDEEILDNILTWQYNGSKSTIDEFRELDSETKQDVTDFIKEEYYDENAENWSQMYLTRVENWLYRLEYNL